MRQVSPTELCSYLCALPQVGTKGADSLYILFMSACNIFLLHCSETQCLGAVA